MQGKLGRRLITAAATLVFTAFAQADVINVPADQPTIQAGIDAAVNGDEVVVAPGTYEEIIDLSGKAITVRGSGGAAVTIIDATNVADPGTGKPVVRIDSGEGPDTVIEGLTLTGGTGDTSALGAGTPVGGGMYNGVGVSPTVNDCIFSGNVVGVVGGGMFNNEASPTITGCSFTNNSAAVGGGGMYNFAGGAPALSGCLFSGNHTTTDGGGISAVDGDLTLTGCTFLGNTADEFTGGIHFSGSGSDGVLTMTNCRLIGNVAGSGVGGMFLFAGSGSAVVNCAFIGNAAGGDGGGLFLQSTLPVVNCTFAGNSASGNGGGLYVDIAISPPIANSVFWGNSDAGGMDESAQIHRNNAPNTTVSYSIVQGGWSGNGTNNLDADPLFVDADGADDTIGTQDDDVRLSAGSPAIDSGDYDAYVAAGGPTVDIDGLPRTYDDVSSANVGVGVLAYLDRGAHEYGAEALLENACCINGECVILTQSDCERVGGTYHGDETDCGSVVCDLPIPGDFDGDGDVDMVDYQIFQAAFTGPL